MIKAVIFDMDGVIADTEPIHESARNILLSELGLDVETISARAIGRGKRAFWGEVVQQYRLPYTAEQLTVREFDYIMEIVGKMGLQPSAGLKELLEYLKACNIKTAVASSSDRNYVERILEVTDLKNYFSEIACGNEVAKTKPAPDVYLKILDLLGVKAAEALAVEDSDTGARAAAAAGIKCVAYDVVVDKKLKQKFNDCSYKIQDIRVIENIVQGEDCSLYAI